MIAICSEFGNGNCAVRMQRRGRENPQEVEIVGYKKYFDNPTIMTESENGSVTCLPRLADDYTTKPIRNQKGRKLLILYLLDMIVIAGLTD